MIADFILIFPRGTTYPGYEWERAKGVSVQHPLHNTIKSAQSESLLINLKALL
jgi:hypothetical protein